MSSQSIQKSVSLTSYPVQTIRLTERNPLLSFNIEIGPGVSILLEVYSHDNPTQVVETEESKQKLANTLKLIIQSALKGRSLTSTPTS
ncbi:hypothetical protein PHYBLDRAFT_139186 [Phycomyces blakesleeanus NRRL 1555(-)]|uniref:Uncharacterized protein n=1 Tax=Phycomyces blakesleeanus (strain ATCC 8743b / DSM 1359 / FGSC 10004 / NBRC 33097 / NRRL 1555) TaxID=763407 RepID=A0A167Q6D0_PHYB8|nr:hypothetical protein PHYBLDRAFT_139186 [Phycomyces blakesleeanus NRRL 1555(-)]OAD79149.1 hypothetical protein PHYBLDRAFT_139186 [Phycomyces blakesleeanus NRRL 1555(-)]|eukprot:XP_018297189.1 hypothetical protein PHYBLDRAFT_139186 [Phycomyces blakesleeanus NRRL 1555(-)]